VFATLGGLLGAVLFGKDPAPSELEPGPAPPPAL